MAILGSLCRSGWRYVSHPITSRQLIEVDTVKIAGVVVSCRFDPESLATTLMQLFEVMNALHVLRGITDAMTIRASEEVIAVLERMLGNV